MEVTGMDDKIRNLFEVSEKSRQVKMDDICECVRLEYGDTGETGLFGIMTGEGFDVEEPFVGTFWCKGHGDNCSKTHDYDINIEMPVKHARQIYHFLKKYFGDEEASNGQHT
jgi:hypothetical protein